MNTCPHKVPDTVPCEQCLAAAEPPGFQISGLLSSRQTYYGEFPDNARIADKLLKVLQGQEHDLPTNWHRLGATKRQGIVMIVLKLSRALSPSGNPEYVDNWRDIQGYARLIEESCHES